jgi:hypothetical protein
VLQKETDPDFSSGEGGLQLCRRLFFATNKTNQWPYFRLQKKPNYTRLAILPVG